MPMTFGEAMLSLIKKRGLSATTVAQELGFRSRTAFFRILHDESRLPSIEKCLAAAENSKLLSLSGEELSLLREAMRVSELGRYVYEMNRVLHRMIYPVHSAMPADEILVEGVEGVSTFEEIISAPPSGGKFNIIILGRCRKHMMDRFLELTQTHEVEKIVHLFAIDEEDAEDIKIFSTISDIVFSRVYASYYISETNVPVKNWWLRSGILLIDHEDELGQHRTLQLTWLGRNRYLGFIDRSLSVIGYWKMIIENAFGEMVPLKQASGGEGESNDLAHYIEFTDRFRKLEFSRAIYMIKPDLPINCVPADILRENLFSGIDVEPEEMDEQAKALFTRLYKIHQARFDNLFSKKKPTHIVLSPQAMMDFARTGQRTDHFFLGRPYTPQERVKILTHLLNQTRDNPNFSIWMSSSPDLLSDKEVTVYDGYGVAMVKADTSWRIREDCDEIMLESTMLAHHFKSYVFSDVLGRRVMPREACIALLEEMIDAAKASDA